MRLGSPLRTDSCSAWSERTTTCRRWSSSSTSWERVRRELKEAGTDEQRAVLSGATQKLQRRLQEARDALARFRSDPQRVIDERRAKLQREQDEQYDVAASYRRQLGLPAPYLPDSRIAQSEQSPLSSPTSYASSCATRSVHKRRLASYVC